MAAGNAMFIRTFKVENELEVWLQTGDRFELFATYPICHWSGTLGPKITEGDKQTPEGIYTVNLKQVHASARHPKALNLGFPNVLDRHLDRTGSLILIHGGCGSVGCFGMTNPVIDEIFALAQAALWKDQEVIHVHSFPFRMTDQNMRAFGASEWASFWQDLKPIHDAFERTRRVPHVTVCDDRYQLQADDSVPQKIEDKSGTSIKGRPHAQCAPSLQRRDTEVVVTMSGDGVALNPHSATLAKRATGSTR
jgi:murein L,D-transpeptidase YafK